MAGFRARRASIAEGSQRLRVGTASSQFGPTVSERPIRQLLSVSARRQWSSTAQAKLSLERVLSVGLDNTDADALVREIREQFRLSRDIEILTSAATEYAGDGSRSQVSLDGILQLLSSENDADWDNYFLSYFSPTLTSDCDGKSAKIMAVVPQVVSPGAPPEVSPEVKCVVYKPAFSMPDFGDDAFEGDDYNVVEYGRQFRYLSPPITENDFRFRSMGDRPEINRKALLSGRYRLVSLYNKKRTASLDSSWVGRVGRSVEREPLGAASDRRCSSSTEGILLGNTAAGCRPASSVFGCRLA